MRTRRVCLSFLVGGDAVLGVAVVPAEAAGAAVQPEELERLVGAERRELVVAAIVAPSRLVLRSIIIFLTGTLAIGVFGRSESDRKLGRSALSAGCGTVW